MQIVKQSVARAIPCLLIKTSDGQTPETGALAASVTISYRKEGGTTWSSKTATGNWTEVTSGKGAYLISWSTTDLNTVGRFDFVVEHASCINYYGSLVVSANLLDDLATDIGALNDLDAAGVLAAVTTDDTKWDGADLDAAISSRSSHAAAEVVALMNDPTVAQIAEAVHDVKVSFDKTTGALVITMADDTPLTSVTITDTAGEVTRE